MSKADIIIIETAGRIFEKFGRFLIHNGHHLRSVQALPELTAAVMSKPCDVIIAFDPLTQSAPADLLKTLKKQNIVAPVLFVTDHPSVHRAVEAIQYGAGDYMLISDDEALLSKSIDNILKYDEPRTSETHAESCGATLVCASPAMRRLLEMARRIAPSSATVLIQGESGTGKELLAKHIHHHSGRINHGFVAMNCAALPDSLAESELFGFERGAFTGAVQRKPGKFELANKGTLLLDEISEMPLPMQAKLLRVLQEKEVDRIGGQKPIPINVRVIATTNCDLGQMVNEGLFRKDLFYRLRIIPLTIPPLRSRQEDIPVLVDYFLKKYCQPGEPLPQFDASAMKKMIHWHWPGNVREMENTIERAVLIRSGPLMGPELLLLDEQLDGSPSDTTARLVGLTVKELEERLIVQTLRHVNQNRTHAAEMLGISIRTLRNKLREYHDSSEELSRSAAYGS